MRPMNNKSLASRSYWKSQGIWLWTSLVSRIGHDLILTNLAYLFEENYPL